MNKTAKSAVGLYIGFHNISLSEVRLGSLRKDKESLKY